MEVVFIIYLLLYSCILMKINIILAYVHLVENWLFELDFFKCVKCIIFYLFIMNV